MRENSELIVLNHTKYREKSVILHTISKNWGRKGFFIKNIKSNQTSVLLPLSIIEADIDLNTKTNLATATNLYSVYSLLGIRNNIYKNSICLFISEVLYRLVGEGVMLEGFFNWCKTQIILLNNIEQGFANFHIRFLLELCMQLGYFPSWEDIEPFFNNKEDEVIKVLLNASFEEFMFTPMSGQTRTLLCENILNYIQFHTDIKLNIRSLSILRELYL